MNLATMFSSGPTLKAKPKKHHRYSTSVMVMWKEIYRCIGVGERTAVEVTVKLNRTRREGTPEFKAKAINHSLRTMEKLRFVSQRQINVDHSTKPVMTWKRLKEPSHASRG